MSLSTSHYPLWSWEVFAVPAPEIGQGIRLVSWSPLEQEITAFLVDRGARGLAETTVEFYRKKLGVLRGYLQSVGVERVDDITAPVLRRYLLWLAETHNPGGVHALYRALKTFLLWWEAEVEPEGWRNPIERVPPPKVPTAPLQPVPLSHVKKMVATCKGRDFLPSRDKAMLLCLLDTGLRASEFLALDVSDVNLSTGAVLVRKGKGSKWRTAFVGHKMRRALLAYLRHRGDPSDDPGPLHGSRQALWLTTRRGRLSYGGLRHVLDRRAEQAGVPTPSLHSFRRAFALLSLRAGVDIYSLQRLMGHADLSVLRRYLAQTEEDLRLAHEKGGPVDRML